jgi:hypothetical protein
MFFPLVFPSIIAWPLGIAFLGVTPSFHVVNIVRMPSWPLKVKAMGRPMACLLSKAD